MATKEVGDPRAHTVPALPWKRMRLILDLCGGTGSWSKPYTEAGYFVRVVDVKNGDDVRLLEYIEEPVHGILAAPPCTEFSYAKHFHGKGNYEHNFIEGLSMVDACLRIVMVHKPRWWALENPYNYLRRWLGEPEFVFEPWQFGNAYKKRTALWGDFRQPKPTISEEPAGLVKFSMLKSHEIAPEWYGIENRQTRRAITPPGFARAFFEANP